MNSTDIVLLVGLAACVGGAAVLAAAEVTLIRIRRAEVVVSAEEGDTRSTALLRLLDDLPATLNSVLLVVLLLQVGAATISGVLAARWFGALGVTASSVVLTFVLFVYGEAIPKTLAVRSPLRYARRLTRVLRVVRIAARPAVSVLLRLADLQSVGQPDFGAVTERQLLSLARESAEVGEIEPEDAALVERSFEFGDQRAGDIMIPRAEIEAVVLDESVTDAFARAVAAGHRRLPVLDGDLDHVAGIVRLRDVAAAATGEEPPTVESVMTPVLFCAADEPISDLLRRMQAAGRWLAIVRGERGSTVGLLTIEDIVAELVGEIADERAVEQPRDP